MGCCFIFIQEQNQDTLLNADKNIEVLRHWSRKTTVKQKE